MSAPAATTTSTAVHVTIPNFAALSEHGNWDACSIVAEMDALHVCPWGDTPFDDYAATQAKLKQWRAEYLAAGRWTVGEGTTLANIYWHLQLHANHLTGYLPYNATPDLTKLHSFVKAQMLAQNPVIIEVSNAQALPHAEQGVHYHFVTLGGIDSTLGYLVANGDTLEALGSAALTVPTNWATWQQLVAAGICGAIGLQRLLPAPPPPPPPPPPAPPAAPVTQEMRDELHNILVALESQVTAVEALAALLGGA